MGCRVSSLESRLKGFGLVAFRCFCERGSVCLRERERETERESESESESERASERERERACLFVVGVLVSLLVSELVLVLMLVNARISVCCTAHFLRVCVCVLGL